MYAEQVTRGRGFLPAESLHKISPKGNPVVTFFPFLPTPQVAAIGGNTEGKFFKYRNLERIGDPTEATKI